MSGPRSFILAACNGAPMIFSRLDWQREADEAHVGGVGAQLLEQSYEPTETDVLLKLLNIKRQARGAGVFAIDCGAHVGALLVPMAQHMEGWGHVLGIEAQERMFYALAGNIALNNLWNARAIWGAVAERNGFIEGPIVDYTRPTNFGGVSLIPKNNGQLAQRVTYGIPVPAFSIDSFNFPRVDVIKIDVEGMEREVLAGARNTIATCQPAMVIEHIKVDGGATTIREALPGYRVEVMGIDTLCMPANDPVWNNVKITDTKHVA